VIENFHPVAVLDRSGLVVDGGDPVAQNRLRGRDVIHFENAAAATATSEEQEEQRQ